VHKLGNGHKPSEEKPFLRPTYFGIKAPLDTTDLKTSTTRLFARNRSLVIIVYLHLYLELFSSYIDIGEYLIVSTYFIFLAG